MGSTTNSLQHLYINLTLLVYLYQNLSRFLWLSLSPAHTHTHTAFIHYVSLLRISCFLHLFPLKLTVFIQYYSMHNAS